MQSSLRLLIGPSTSKLTTDSSNTAHYTCLYWNQNAPYIHHYNCCLIRRVFVVFVSNLKGSLSICVFGLYTWRYSRWGSFVNQIVVFFYLICEKNGYHYHAPSQKRTCVHFERIVTYTNLSAHTQIGESCYYFRIRSRSH